MECIELHCVICVHKEVCTCVYNMGATHKVGAYRFSLNTLVYKYDQCTHINHSDQLYILHIIKVLFTVIFFYVYWSCLSIVGIYYNNMCDKSSAVVMASAL